MSSADFFRSQASGCAASGHDHFAQFYGQLGLALFQEEIGVQPQQNIACWNPEDLPYMNGTPRTWEDTLKPQSAQGVVQRLYWAFFNHIDDDKHSENAWTAFPEVDRDTTIAVNDASGIGQALRGGR